MMNSLLTLSIAALLLSSTVSAQGASRYHAAKCLAEGRDCNAYLQFWSGACKARYRAEQQSDVCRMQACRWCALDGKAAIAPCTAPVLRRLCDLDSDMLPLPSPMAAPMVPLPPSPPPSMPMAPQMSPEPDAEGMCTWRGDESVVIGLDRVAPADGWTPVSRNGLRGLVYRKDLNHGIVQPAKGEMCFRVRAAAAGDYRLTFVSYAPHTTENNDAWIKTDKPLRFVSTKRGRRGFTRALGTYMKAYQNFGRRRGMSSDMHNKDHDPHKFVVVGVRAGETFSVCMAGRSYRFEVYKIILKKCAGNLCSNGGKIPREEAIKMKVSQCS